MATDDSPSGRASRQVARELAVPMARDGLNRVTKNGPVWAGSAGPYVGKFLDVARSANPLGAVMTGSMNAARKPIQDSEVDSAVTNAVGRHPDMLTEGNTPLMSTARKVLKPITVGHAYDAIQDQQVGGKQLPVRAFPTQLGGMPDSIIRASGINQ